MAVVDMPTVDIEFLSRLPFLQGAGPQVLRGLAAAAVEKSAHRGEVILEEGTTGRELFVIIEGSVEVLKGRGGQQMRLATRGPGEFLGEMGLIEARPRFATVRALQPTRLLEFSEESLHSVLAEQPALLYQAVRVLMARLREADLKMIADLQGKNVELAEAYRGLQEAQAALVEKERLEHELALARDLQQSILPHQFPPLPGFDFAARSRPAQQVGGDFYDVIPLAKDRVGLVMADVSDKGMPAALYMALTRSLIHAEAKRSVSPRRVLLNVHRLLMEMSKAEMFVTAFYGVLDGASGSLRYARAGHDRPLLLHRSSGECQLLDAQGMLLGYLERVSLEEAEAVLDSGDVLVLYSDGITDAVSQAGDFFGVERLRQTVCRGGGLGAQPLCDRVFEQVDAFQAGAAQHDDMALLVVKSDGAP
jgi:sigma-B regulation protein RsbU (phosphoserine phosphatase)